MAVFIRSINLKKNLVLLILPARVRNNFLKKGVNLSREIYLACYQPIRPGQSRGRVFRDSRAKIDELKIERRKRASGSVGNQFRKRLMTVRNDRADLGR